MRTTLNLDEDLMQRALAATGAKSKTEVIELGLKSLVEREVRRQLKKLHGRRPELEPVRRRRA
jgi:Arc/MetJ family transcription regulator